jgi:hypothetical protein
MVTLGGTTGSTSAGQTSLIRVNSPCGVFWSWVTVIRTCGVLTVAVNGTRIRTALLPVIVAALCHCVPSQVSTVKSTGTPSELDRSVMPDSVTGCGAVMVSTSG